MQPNYQYIIGTVSLHALIATVTSTKQERYTHTCTPSHRNTYTPTQHVHVHVHVYKLEGGKKKDFPIPDVDFPMERYPLGFGMIAKKMNPLNFHGTGVHV